MYSVSVLKDPNNSSAIEIVFSGELTIENIDAIYLESTKELANCNSCQITTKDVEDIDLSFLQFIISLEKSFQAQNKKVLKNIQIQETFSELFSNTGLETIIT